MEESEVSISRQLADGHSNSKLIKRHPTASSSKACCLESFKEDCVLIARPFAKEEYKGIFPVSWEVQEGTHVSHSNWFILDCTNRSPYGV
jgi:hypothetical protein